MNTDLGDKNGIFYDEAMTVSSRYSSKEGRYMMVSRSRNRTEAGVHHLWI